MASALRDGITIICGGPSTGKTLVATAIAAAFARRNRTAAPAEGRSQAMEIAVARRNVDGVAGYSAKALARVWKSERFSWSLTKLMHRFPEDGPFERRMQVAELDYIASSEAAQRTIAENYVGLPV